VDYLVADPDGAFKKAHVQAHPEATFQFIALRYLEGQSWQEMSEILDVPIPTDRCRFSPNSLSLILQKEVFLFQSLTFFHYVFVHDFYLVNKLVILVFQPCARTCATSGAALKGQHVAIGIPHARGSGK